MLDYYTPVLVPERHRVVVEAFVADLEAMERFASETGPGPGDRLDG